MVDLPDRSGWLTGALAASPPVPPFPDLTVFERRALAVLGALFGMERVAFAEQV